jgi:hypothetical protein
MSKRVTLLREIAYSLIVACMVGGCSLAAIFIRRDNNRLKGRRIGHGIEDYGGKCEPKRRTEIVMVSSFCGS